MSRWGLGRRPKGRHALGAAVTELPSAPVRGTALPAATMVEAAVVVELMARELSPVALTVVPEVDPPPPPVVPIPDLVPPPRTPLETTTLEPDFLASLHAELHGGPHEADPLAADPSSIPWSPDPSPVWVPDPVPAADALMGDLPRPVLLTGAEGFASLLETAADWPDSSAPLFVPTGPLPDLDAVDDLPTEVPFEAPADLPSAPVDAKVLPDAPPVPLQVVARVQLGFRDGTTAVLDPDSEQAHALEELALLLTARH